MKVEYVGPFAEAAYQILEQMLEVPVTRGRLSMMKSPIGSNGVIVLIGLAGEIEGRVSYDMTKATALKVAEVMNGMEFKEFDELARSTISELGNIVTGRAITVLNDRGFKFNITPPTLLIGDNLEVFDSNIEVLVIPLECKYGTISVNVALRSTKK